MAGLTMTVPDRKFDSYLLLHNNGVDNHTLTLVLKIFLKPVDTGWLPYKLVQDWDKNTFVAERWPPLAWSQFKERVARQSKLWNDRFWLIPTAAVPGLDVKVGSRTLRPNIYCHLYVEIVGSAGGAHKTIEAMYLNPKATSVLAGVAENKITSGTFRSDSGHYDSYDVVPRTESSVDDKGTSHKHANYRTVVHEIGHALGLPHIGVSHGDSACQISIAVDGLFKAFSAGSAVPALFAGGSASRACYGDDAVAGRADNVMGRGSHFDTTNAAPWRTRIGQHTSTLAANWIVSMHKVLPKLIP